VGAAGWVTVGGGDSTVLGGVGLDGLGGAASFGGAVGVCAGGTVVAWRAGVIGGSAFAGGDGTGAAVV
jgi:hypothetical protein